VLQDLGSLCLLTAEPDEGEEAETDILRDMGEKERRRSHRAPSQARPRAHPVFKPSPC
jgi:hypothetical protein